MVGSENYAKELDSSITWWATVPDIAMSLHRIILLPQWISYKLYVVHRHYRDSPWSPCYMCHSLGNGYFYYTYIHAPPDQREA